MRRVAKDAIVHVCCGELRLDGLDDILAQSRPRLLLPNQKHLPEHKSTKRHQNPANHNVIKRLGIACSGGEFLVDSLAEVGVGLERAGDGGELVRAGQLSDRLSTHQRTRRSEDKGETDIK